MAGTGIIASTEQIARVCHEANRAWCEANGDTSQVSWDEAEDWQRQSALTGVQAVLDGTGDPHSLHEKWCEDKIADGWTFGQVKDAEAKTHPCLVDYDELPPEQRAKDELFLAVVSSLGRVSL